MDPLRVAPRMTESEDDCTKKTRNWIARFLHRGRYGALPVREGGEQRSASQGDNCIRRTSRQTVYGLA